MNRPDPEGIEALRELYVTALVLAKMEGRGQYTLVKGWPYKHRGRHYDLLMLGIIQDEFDLLVEEGVL